MRQVFGNFEKIHMKVTESYQKMYNFTNTKYEPKKQKKKKKMNTPNTVTYIQNGLKQINFKRN